MIFPEDDARSRAKKLELLEKMEVIAKEAPWKFGFSEVQAHWAILVVRCEILGDVSRNSVFFPGGAFVCFTQCMVLSWP